MSKNQKKLRRKSPRSPGNSGSQGSSGSSLFKILPVLALFGIGFYFFTNKSEIKMNIAAVKPDEKISLPALPPRAIEALADDEPEAPKNDIPLQQRRANFFADMELGISSVSVKVENGKLSIPLTFIAKKQWCKPGDLDTVKILIKDAKSPEILVSLEPISSTRKGASFRVSRDQLFKGFEHTFEVEVKDPESLGLFICRDLEKSGSCRKKILMPYKDLTEKLADPDVKVEEWGKDYILYFQNLVLKGGKLATFKNSTTKDSYRNKLQKQLENAYKINAADFNTAWKYNAAMRSISPTVENNKISLTLPYNDPRCGPHLPGSQDNEPDQPSDGQPSTPVHQ